jgi:hypothetical protein
VQSFFDRFDDRADLPLDAHKLVVPARVVDFTRRFQSVHLAR